MATQFASLTPTVRFPAPRQSVRIAYSSQSSLVAIADALTEQPTPVVEATLEELAIASQAQNVVETAQRLLSPTMYTAFLSWMEDAYRFASLRTGGDDEAFRLCDKHADNGYRIAAMAPANEHDAAFQTYLYAIEASDCSCAGPLTNELGSEHLVGALIEPFLENVLERSELVTLLDTLAQQAWAFSATTSAFDVAIGEAVIRVAKEAQAADTHKPRSLTMPSTYSPFLRGAWLAWQRAYGRWIEAEREANGFYDRVLGPAERAYNKVRDQYPDREGDADPEVQAAWAAVEYPKEWDARNHSNWATQHEAFEALMTTPAPGPEELAIKLKLFRKEDAHNLVRAGALIDCLLADARRFGRQGAYLQTDRSLLTAISDRTELEQHWPQQDSEAEWNEYAERVSAANERVIATPASTIEGTLDKLRVAFAHSSIMCWSQLALTDPADPAFRKGLAESGDADRMMWSAIEDLARIAGIDLGGPTSVVPTSQHRAWLHERNDLLKKADRSEADVSDEAALDRINQLDAMIADTPATSADDMIAKLLLATQVHAEGMDLPVNRAAALVREATAHLGMGYVYSPEVAA